MGGAMPPPAPGGGAPYAPGGGPYWPGGGPGMPGRGACGAPMYGAPAGGPCGGIATPPGGMAPPPGGIPSTALTRCTADLCAAT